MGEIELYSKRFLAISLVGVGDVESLRRGLSLLMELRGILSWDWEMFFYAGYAEMQVVGGCSRGGHSETRICGAGHGSRRDGYFGRAGGISRAGEEGLRPR